MTAPLRPEDIAEAKRQVLPDAVVDVFNELIAKTWDGTAKWARVRQIDAQTLIAERMEIPMAMVFEKHYLDVEDVYRAAGWLVEYDKPGYNESYPAVYTFRRRERP